MFEDEHLHSLSLGLVSNGRDGVNCENSEEVGFLMQKQLENVKMPKCKIKRADQVKSLITLQHSFKVDGKSVSFDPTTLFIRLTAVAQRESDDIEGFFEFELTQEPMSLFSKGFLRKPDKSCLRKSILKDEAAITKEQFQIIQYL